MQNIEIKAHYPDHEKARGIVKKIGAELSWTDEQVDTYFITPHGRLKLRESGLRPAELIPYMRPDSSGPKKCEYSLAKIEEPAAFKKLLARILGVDVIVHKKRTVYIYENVRIHLDEVKGLGSFFEFEAVYADAGAEKTEREKVDKLVQVFKIEPAQLLTQSYRELMKEAQSI